MNYKNLLQQPIYADRCSKAGTCLCDKTQKEDSILGACHHVVRSLVVGSNSLVPKLTKNAHQAKKQVSPFSTTVRIQVLYFKLSTCINCFESEDIPERHP